MQNKKLMRKELSPPAVLSISDLNPEGPSLLCLCDTAVRPTAVILCGPRLVLATSDMSMVKVVVCCHPCRHPPPPPPSLTTIHSIHIQKLGPSSQVSRSQTKTVHWPSICGE